MDDIQGTLEYFEAPRNIRAEIDAHRCGRKHVYTWPIVASVYVVIRFCCKVCHQRIGVSYTPRLPLGQSRESGHG